MEGKGTHKRINMARKNWGFTAVRLSKLCKINVTFLRQIEGGTKFSSLPIFINICSLGLSVPRSLLRRLSSRLNLKYIKYLMVVQESL